MKISSKFHWIWTSFVQDSTFEALFTGSLGATGLTGIDYRSDRSDRSDRGAAPVRPVPGCEVCRFSRSLPCFLSIVPRVFLCWFSSSISIPHFTYNSRGWVRNWEIGRTFASAKFLIGSHSPPSGRLFGPSHYNQHYRGSILEHLGDKQKSYISCPLR